MQGLAKAQYNLGVCYERGCGVVKDYGKAVEWYQKAAEQGYAHAQYNLGMFYENGYGVPKDNNKAIEFYKKAAAQGDESSKEALKKLNVQE
jgi:TPR repeat protein